MLVIPPLGVPSLPNSSGGSNDSSGSSDSEGSSTSTQGGTSSGGTTSSSSGSTAAHTSSGSDFGSSSGSAAAQQSSGNDFGSSSGTSSLDGGVGSQSTPFSKSIASDSGSEQPTNQEAGLSGSAGATRGIDLSGLARVTGLVEEKESASAAGVSENFANAQSITDLDAHLVAVLLDDVGSILDLTSRESDEENQKVGVDFFA